MNFVILDLILMAEELDMSNAGSGAGPVIKEARELPRTKWPTIAGLSMIITMGLLLFTAWLSYYSGEYVDTMTGTGPIEGYIFENQDGSDVAVESVNVSIDGTDLWALTDSDGYYELEDVPVSIQTIRFSKPGYRTVVLSDIVYSTKDIDDNNLGSNNFSLPMNLRGGMYIDPLWGVTEKEFIDLLNGTVTVTVLNETGLPASDIIITYSESAENGQSALELRKNTSTDEMGMFQLNLTAGRYVVNISEEGYRTIHKEVLIAPGKDSMLGITLFPGSGLVEEYLNQTGIITGVVRTDTDEPIKDVVLRVEGTDLTTTTNVAGEYTLENFPVGPVILKISRESYGEHLVTNLFVEDNLSKDFVLESLGEEVIDNTDTSLYYYCALVYVITAVLLLGGGIMALKRKAYGFALIAALTGIAVSVPVLPLHHCIAIVLCLLAVVGVFVSRREFS
jgi:hypothetical protein